MSFFFSARTIYTMETTRSNEKPRERPKSAARGRERERGKRENMIALFLFFPRDFGEIFGTHFFKNETRRSGAERE